MKSKGALTATAVGAGLLVWMMAPMASASTTTATLSVSIVTKVPRPDVTYFYLCNLESNGEIYGCAESNGYLHAATLSEDFVTTFSYNATTEHIQQEGTANCLEYNSGSATYPVRMDTCTDGRASQEWFTSAYGADQLENGYSGTCLEGGETDGYGHPLTMSPCSKKYAGQNWIAA